MTSLHQKVNELRKENFLSFPYCFCHFQIFWLIKDDCPVNALRAQNLAGGHFLVHEIRLVFVSLSIWAILGIN